MSGKNNIKNKGLHIYRLWLRYLVNRCLPTICAYFIPASGDIRKVIAYYTRFEEKNRIREIWN